jgi:hypothetical protein
MGERGTRSQVSGVREVELKCLSVENLESLAQMGHPVFPFIYQGKDLGYTRERERKRKRRKRKIETKRALGLRLPSPPQVGPAGPADDNGSVLTSQPYLSLVLQAGVVAQPWRPVPSWHVVWSTDPLDWSHMGIQAAQCRSAQCCWRRESPGIACRGHRSRRDVFAPSLALEAWS